MGINTLEELKTFRDFLILKGKPKKYSIRETLQVADIVLPVDRWNSRRPSGKISNT